VFLVSRMKDESIVINDDIILTVIEIGGDKVRLGVEQPQGVKIHRREVYEAILSQKGVDQGT
jgi:carbon storage regulator